MTDTRAGSGWKSQRQPTPSSRNFRRGYCDRGAIGESSGVNPTLSMTIRPSDPRVAGNVDQNPEEAPDHE